MGQSDFVVVSLQMHNGHAGGEPVWLHYGRRNGSWKNSAVHSAPMDTSQTIPTTRETCHRKVHHRLPIELGKKLGE